MLRMLCLVYAGLMLLAVDSTNSPVGDQEQPPGIRGAQCRLPVLDGEAAWQKLPKVEAAAHRRLPDWARALASPLPRTTAVLLELDDLYRTSEAFDPKLRATMRWVAARANRCAYSQTYAEADLMRNGLSREEVSRLEASLATLPASQQAAVTFARKLTLDASSVSDDEVAELMRAFGEQAVVAMVLQIAYANFQDRLLLALNVDIEADGPLPPLQVQFVPLAPGETVTAAPRPEPPVKQAAARPIITLERDWSAVAFDQLKNGMEKQQSRVGRVSVPAWDEVHARLPAGLYPADRPIRIRWSLVVLGHQPAMGSAWIKALRTFGREANQDRVFEETLFWVITRTIHCFY